MSHHHYGILARVLFQHLLKIREAGLRAQRILHYQFAFVPHFVAYQRRGLRGSL